MKKIRIYFGLQLKTVIKMLPVILLGTVVFSVLLLGGVLAADKMLAGQQQSSVMNVALVVNDDNKYTEIAINMLVNEENIKELCSFTEMSEADAIAELSTGQVTAAVVIPENFLAGVLNGTNIPARIILPDGNGFSRSLAFRELVSAGASDLATAQAAIYAVDDLCRVAGIDAIAESEDYLNKKLFLYALGRNKYYDKFEVAKTGDLSVVEFYMASGLVMFLLFGGVICGEFLGRENQAVSVCLGRVGVSGRMIVCAKLFSVSLVYFVMLAAAYCVGCALDVVSWSFTSLLGIFVVVAAVFGINLFVFRTADSVVTGSIVLFIGTIVMMFASGNIIPEFFLPEIVNRIGYFMPTKWIVGLAGQVLCGEVVMTDLVIVGAIGAVFAVLSVAERRLK